jgi:hypothetical protein
MVLSFCSLLNLTEVFSLAPIHTAADLRLTAWYEQIPFLSNMEGMGEMRTLFSAQVSLPQIHALRLCLAFLGSFLCIVCGLVSGPVFRKIVINYDGFRPW